MEMAKERVEQMAMEIWQVVGWDRGVLLEQKDTGARVVLELVQAQVGVPGLAREWGSVGPPAPTFLNRWPSQHHWCRKWRGGLSKQPLAGHLKQLP
mmetsp:Transcript_37793/g.81854  ORF Transcript_37793/g.81854 Transcript_37793/m.81854 type:complete len:96 (+) Transcript_37793:2510-2797(+)